MLIKFSSVLTIFLLVFAPHAIAQCATGVDTGGGSCIPPDAPGMPNVSGNIPQPDETRAIIESRWGAIVFGVDKKADGSVTGFSTKKEAVKAGMEKCHSEGAKNCQLQFTYANQCAAVAWGDDDYAIDGAVKEVDAESLALEACKKLTASCKIVHVACSYPERVN